MATAADAELILKCYDLRREALMRKARDTMMAWFPQSYEEVRDTVMGFGTERNAFLRQVGSYWEMVYAMCNHGAMDRALTLDTCGEGLFLYAKLKPFLGRLREETGNPAAFKQTETFIEKTPGAPQKVMMIEERLKKMAAGAAKKG